MAIDRANKTMAFRRMTLPLPTTDTIIGIRFQRNCQRALKERYASLEIRINKWKNSQELDELKLKLKNRIFTTTNNCNVTIPGSFDIKHEVRESSADSKYNESDITESKGKIVIIPKRERNKIANTFANAYNGVSNGSFCKLKEFNTDLSYIKNDCLAKTLNDPLKLTYCKSNNNAYIQNNSSTSEFKYFDSNCINVNQIAKLAAMNQINHQISHSLNKYLYNSNYKSNTKLKEKSGNKLHTPLIQYSSSSYFSDSKSLEPSSSHKQRNLK